MSSFRTGASSTLVHDAAADATPVEVATPGLVLLYAAGHAALAPAYPFARDELVLGRDATCDVPLEEQAVSRRHAAIVRRADRWLVRDLESRNGTLVDGVYVREAELSAHAVVRVGDALFAFVPDGADLRLGYPIGGDDATTRRSSSLGELVGGALMDHVAADIERIAPTELSCVVLGETGTGKEVAARGIHRLSGRRGSFQAINCAAIPATLLESELFGYRRGAFSGADRDKPGLVKLADGGTLFLDEIGDMPLDAQAKLLRVLQSREVFPLGGTTAERVDLRVVCATHRDLYRNVREGKFRGDLLARLNEHVVRLPPLRERKEDVLLLVRAFCARFGRPDLVPTFPFLVALYHYDWPFNVRELESCIKRACALADGETLDARHLPDALVEHLRGYGRRGTDEAAAPPPPVAGPAPRRAPTEPELRALLESHHGNVAAVGRALGKERMQIHRWLKRYGLDPDTFRDGGSGAR